MGVCCSEMHQLLHAGSFIDKFHEKCTAWVFTRTCLMNVVDATCIISLLRFPVLKRCSSYEVQFCMVRPYLKCFLGFESIHLIQACDPCGTEDYLSAGLILGKGLSNCSSERSSHPARAVWAMKGLLTEPLLRVSFMYPLLLKILGIYCCVPRSLPECRISI